MTSDGPPHQVTFGTLINGLTRPYGANNNVASARRALQLWAEMRLLGLAPDARIVTPLFDACTRHVGVETVLKLRVELVRMGWNVAALRPHDQVLIAALPSLKEVLRDQPKWEALGVRLPPTLGSEQAQLSLTMPALPTAVVPPAAMSVPFVFWINIISKIFSSSIKYNGYMSWFFMIIF
jgi:hypothetical protein